MRLSVSTTTIKRVINMVIYKCKLVSCVPDVPDLSVSTGQLIIGRNRTCKIKDLKCSRSHLTVEVDDNQLIVKDSEGSVRRLSNGKLISGPGFEYKIVMIAVDEQVDKHDQEKKTEWSQECSGQVYICSFLGGGCQSTDKIAAFDLDGTLITTKSGKYPVDDKDWVLLNKSLPERIQKLTADGYRFVVITNQLGISKGIVKLEHLQKRLEGALQAIGCPALILVSIAHDFYRKPRPGLWDLLEKQLHCKTIDRSKSFFVGDAAGRQSAVKGQSDHSASDLLFAYNLKVPFLTPQEFFWNKLAKMANIDDTRIKMPSFNPKKLSNEPFAKDLNSGFKCSNIKELMSHIGNDLHLIVFCGLPASGKTSFYKNYLFGLNYAHISRDLLKTMVKCEKEAEKNLNQKRSCVIDNTNLESISRSKWIQLAKRFSVPVYLFHFKVSVDHAIHNNTFRKVMKLGDSVTDLLIRSFNKNFVPPSLTEGFSSIYQINFLPKFERIEHEDVYFMILAER